MLLVLAFAGVLFGARLGARSFWSEEVRWGEIPREMQLNANYLFPTINGKSYYDKPLGSYWLVLACSWLTGSLDETSVRLPSVLAGLLGVALTMLIARRLYDDNTAVLAGLILATSFSFVFFSRHASADAETVVGVLAALWIFLKHEVQPNGGWIVLLWLVMALTSLTKGLLGFVLPILIIASYSALQMSTAGEQRGLAFFRAQRWLFQPWSLLAIPLAVAVYLTPFLLSYAMEESSEGLAMVYRENIRRFYDPVNHQGPMYLYVYVIFMLMAPWSLLLPAALVQAHSQWRGHRFALTFFWGVFLFFTLAASRRSYYLLPILPAGALLVAHLLTRNRDVVQHVAYRLLQAGVGLFALVVVLSGALLLNPAQYLPERWQTLPSLPHAWVFAGVWIVSLLGVIDLVRGLARFRPARIAAVLTTITAAYMIYGYLLLLPSLEVYRTQKPFAEAVKRQLGPDASEIALYRNREICFYLAQNHLLLEYMSKAELIGAVKDGRVRWLIIRRHDWEDMNLSARVVCEETVFSWEDTDQAKGKLLLAEVIER
jgi:4-amino-4-deoxy-L-arabinose transferase-like glycosyltransferase